MIISHVDLVGELKINGGDPEIRCLLSALEDLVAFGILDLKH